MAFPSPLRKMDDSILRSVDWKDAPHLLHTKWHMWYHNTVNKDYSKSSFVDLFPKPIECLEELILLFNTWDEALPEADQGMFYMMREMTNGPIYPCREDPHNQNGGYWTCKIDTDKAAEVWKKLCFLMITENIVEDWKKINGVSITPKHGFCLVKIWNRKDDDCDTSDLKKYMANFLDLSQVMYFNNKIKIAIDSKRQQKSKPRGDGRNSRTRQQQKRPARFEKKVPQAFQRKEASSFTTTKTPGRPVDSNSKSKPIIRAEQSAPFKGSWRSLLTQQTASTKPTDISQGFYKPPSISKTKRF